MLGRGGGKKIEPPSAAPTPTSAQLADEAKAIMAGDPEALAIQDDWRQPVPVVRRASGRGRRSARVCALGHGWAR